VARWLGRAGWRAQERTLGRSARARGADGGSTRAGDAGVAGGGLARGSGGARRLGTQVGGARAAGTAGCARRTAAARGRSRSSSGGARALGDWQAAQEEWMRRS
jgi:hypothetical protein